MLDVTVDGEKREMTMTAEDHCGRRKEHGNEGRHDTKTGETIRKGGQLGQQAIRKRKYVFSSLENSRNVNLHV